MADVNQKNDSANPESGSLPFFILGGNAAKSGIAFPENRRDFQRAFRKFMQTFD
jgi:hypothetical protein